MHRLLLHEAPQVHGRRDVRGSASAGPVPSSGPNSPLCRRWSACCGKKGEPWLKRSPSMSKKVVSKKIVVASLGSSMNGLALAARAVAPVADAGLPPPGANARITRPTRAAV